MKIILAHAKKPDGLAVIDLLHELGLEPKDRSGLNDNHLKKLVWAGVLKECQAIPEHGKEKRERKRDAHQLNPDPDTFAELLNIFVGTEHLKDFLHSPYVNEMEAIATVFRIVIDTISEHMKPVQSLVEMFGLPSTRESLAAHLSQMVSEIMVNFAHAIEVGSTMPPHSTLADLKRKLGEEHPDS